MDNLAHTLTGLALARAGLGRTSPGATAALVIASNLPDADMIARAFGTVPYLEFHRGLTHSVLGGPMLALATAALLRVIVKGSRLAPLLLCSAVAVAIHVMMDLWTTYGTRILSPFDRGFYAWDLVFVVDPIVWGLLAVAVLAFRTTPDKGQRAARVCLAVLLAYAGARGVLHAKAVQVARALLPASGVHRICALPSPLSPLRWKVLADSDSAVYSGEIDLARPAQPLVLRSAHGGGIFGAEAPGSQGATSAHIGNMQPRSNAASRDASASIYPQDGRISALARRDKRKEDALVARARDESPAATAFLEFARFPWLEVSETPEGRAVSWRDLRFEDVPGLVGAEQAARIRRPGFCARVVVGPDGRIRSEAIRF